MLYKSDIFGGAQVREGECRGIKAHNARFSVRAGSLDSSPEKDYAGNKTVHNSIHAMRHNSYHVKTTRIRS